jgi:hypothetical protein
LHFFAFMQYARISSNCASICLAHYWSSLRGLLSCPVRITIYILPAARYSRRQKWFTMQSHCGNIILGHSVYTEWPKSQLT